MLYAVQKREKPIRKNLMDIPSAHAQNYEIRLKGQLDARWSDRFDGMTITLDENGNTLLSGPLADQAALHGLLKKVRDLGLTLLSVNSVEPDTREVPKT
jgi:hypothetical protein